MPQIPIVNESQAMNVNSPVGIGSADVSMPAAVNKLGSVLENIGTKLEEAQQAQKLQVSKNKIESAAADYWAVQNDFAQTEAVTGKDATRTGLEAVQALRKNGADRQQEMVKNLGMDESEAAAFIAKAKEADNHFTPGLMKQSAEVGNQLYESSRQEALLKQGAIISTDVSMLPHALAEIETKNNADPAIVDKVGQTMKDKAVLFESGISASLRTNNYKQAKTLLDQGVQAGVYTPDESEKKFAHIQSAQQSQSAQYRAQHDYEERVDKAATKERRDNKWLEYTSQMTTAGSDPAALDAVVKKIQNDPDLTQADRINAFTSVKKETGVDLSAYRFSEQFKANLLSPGADTDTAKAALYANTKIPFQAKAPLVQLSQEMTLFEKNNPGGRKAAEPYVQNILKLAEADPTVKGLVKPEVDKNKSAILSDYWNNVFNLSKTKVLNPNDYADAAKQAALKHASGFVVTPPPGASMDNFRDSKRATEWLSTIQEQHMRNPNPSRDELKQRIVQISKAKAAIQILNLKEEASRTQMPQSNQ